MVNKKYRIMLKTVGSNIVSIVAVLVVWSIVSWLAKSSFFPPIWRIWAAFINLATKGDIDGIRLGWHIMNSLVRIFAGFGAGCALGIPLGLLMGLYPKIYDGSRAIIEPIRFIPPIAWIPLAIILLSGFSRYVFIIWLGAFFPIFITTLLSIKGVNPLYVNVSRSFGATRFYIVKKIVIPSVLPDIAAGMRIGMGTAWLTIIAAEMIGGEAVGLGFLIWKYAELIRLSEIIVGMVTIGIIGFILNEMTIRIEGIAFRWKRTISFEE